MNEEQKPRHLGQRRDGPPRTSRRRNDTAIGKLVKKPLFIFAGVALPVLLTVFGFIYNVREKRTSEALQKDSLFYEADALYDSGEYGAAAAQFIKLRSSVPRGSDAWLQCEYREALCYYDIGKLNRSESDLVRAVKLCDECIGNFGEKNSPFLQASVCSLTGNIYAELSYYRQNAENTKTALRNVRKARKLWEDAADIVTLDQETVKKMVDESAKNNSDCYTIYNYIADESLIGECYRRLGAVSRPEENFKNALYFFDRATKLMEMTKHYKEIRENDYVITYISYGKANYAYYNLVERDVSYLKKAVASLEEAKTLCSAEHNVEHYVRVLENLATCYYELSGIENSEQYLARLDQCLKEFNGIRLNWEMPEYVMMEDSLEYFFLVNRADMPKEQKLEIVNQLIEKWEQRQDRTYSDENPQERYNIYLSLIPLYMDRAELENTVESLDRVIKACEEATVFYTEKEYPIVYIAILVDWQRAYFYRCFLSDDTADLKKSCDLANRLIISCCYYGYPCTKERLLDIADSMEGSELGEFGDAMSRYIKTVIEEVEKIRENNGG